MCHQCGHISKYSTDWFQIIDSPNQRLTKITNFKYINVNNLFCTYTCTWSIKYPYPQGGLLEIQRRQGSWKPKYIFEGKWSSWTQTFSWEGFESILCGTTQYNKKMCKIGYSSLGDEKRIYRYNNVILFLTSFQCSIVTVLFDMNASHTLSILSFWTPNFPP